MNSLNYQLLLLTMRNKVREGESVERRGAPYGEARRLRYFAYICSESLKFPSVDMDFLIERLMTSVKRINLKLDEYIRNTGVMRSRAVIRNYLRFADWLDLLRIEQRLVVPNGFTVFFASLGEPEDFFLSDKEKVGFLLHLSKINEFLKLLCSLKMKNAIKEYVRPDLSEHFVESFFEWFVDLSLLTPIRSRFGRFDLSNVGYHVTESCKYRVERDKVLEVYVRELLGFPLERSLSISDDLIWALFEKSLNRLGRYTRSQVDSNLYSALSLILDLQLKLIFDQHILATTRQLTQKLKDISWQHNAVFSWDYLADAGYIKIKR